MTSNTALATHLLRDDRQGLGMLTSMIYDLMRRNETIDLEEVRNP